jgi:small nuclear ribonucleoprotein G
MPQAQPELKKVRDRDHSHLPPAKLCKNYGDGHDYLYLPRLQYMEKRLFVQLNGNRKVLGILRGYDVCGSFYCLFARLCWGGGTVLTGWKVFLNIVLDEAVEEKAGGEKERLGMVVIRGNSVVMLEVSGHWLPFVPRVGGIMANAFGLIGSREDWRR